MSFIWTSDLHFGIENKYTTEEPAGNFIHFASREPDFILLTGDLTDDGSLDQTLKVNSYVRAFSHIPFWLLAGNHDACSECGDLGGCEGGNDPCSEDYVNYRALLEPELHWINDYGSTLRFIGFDSRLIRSQPFLNFGKIEGEELSWLVNAIEESAAAGKKTVLCSHFPLVNDFGNNIKFGQSALFTAMANAGNVILFLSGHRHAGWGQRVVYQGTTHVAGPMLSYGEAAVDPPYSVGGGYFWVTDTGTQLEFQLFAADHPIYTPRPAANFTITY